MNETILNNLEDHIDEPIKKCVVGLALLGFTPIFSCCGFNYHGEKIRKDHFLNKPYIYIDYSKMTSELKEVLLDICFKSRWSIGISGANCVDFHGWKWEKEHPWSADGCLHKPEMNVISLRELEKVLETYRPKFQEQALIRDGNDVWKKDLGLKHWQYAPSESWWVTPDTFDKL
jgi:hypothetical protein